MGAGQQLRTPLDQSPAPSGRVLVVEGDEQGQLVPEAGKRFLNQMFAMGIQGSGGLVEKEYLGPGRQGPVLTTPA